MKQALLVALLSYASIAQSQTVSLVKDVYAGSGSSDIQKAVLLNSKIHFTAKTQATGRELWTSNGWSAGTIQHDIYPGGDMLGTAYSSDPIGIMKTKTDIVVFGAKESGTKGYKLFRMATSVNGAEAPIPFQYLNPSQFNTPGRDLKIKEIGIAQNQIYFSSNLTGQGFELWTALNPSATLGYAATFVRDINPNGDSDPENFINLGSKTYFTAINGTNGRELWVTDGTPTATTMVKDIYPGQMSPMISEMMVFNNKLLFAADNGVKGKELWVSDGTTAGTVMVKDINTRTDQIIVTLPNTNASDPKNFFLFQGKVYFSASDGSGHELWCTDGTSAGTILVKKIKASGGSNPKNFSTYQSLGYATGKLIVPPTTYLTFTADGGSGEELWQTDGTANGTVLLKELRPGSAGSSPSKLYELKTASNGATTITNYYYSAEDGTNGRELWEFNPANNKHTKLAPASGLAANANPLRDADRWPWIQMGNAIYFYANYDSNGGELWKVSRP